MGFLVRVSMQLYYREQSADVTPHSHLIPYFHSHPLPVLPDQDKDIDKYILQRAKCWKVSDMSCLSIYLNTLCSFFLCSNIPVLITIPLYVSNTNTNTITNTHTHTHTHTNTHTHTHTHTHIHVYTYTFYVHVYVDVCIRVCGHCRK